YQIAALHLLDAYLGRLVASLHRAGDADDDDGEPNRACHCPLGSFLHLSFRLAKGMTNGAFQSGEGFVVVVNSVDAITLGALIRCTRFGEVDVRGSADSVTIL